MHSKLGKDDNKDAPVGTHVSCVNVHVSCVMCMRHVSMCMCEVAAKCLISCVCVCVCVCVPLCVCGQISNGETQLKIEKEVCKEGDGAEASDKAMIVLPQGGVVVTGLTKPKTLNPEP